MKSKQSSELFATMTEALSKAHNDISTLALQNARTTPSHIMADCEDTQLCCVQPCCHELRNRAGAHSPVQAHSFYYYSTLCLQTLIAKPLQVVVLAI